MKRLAILFSILLFAAFFLGGCAQETDKNIQDQKGKLQVYTTVYPLKYFTEQIGGEYVEVDTIYPPGADEHTFEPSQKDMITLADADLFFYVGLGLEGFVDKAKKTLENEDVKMVPVGEAIHLEEGSTNEEEVADHNEDDHGNGEGHSHGDVDPHVWLDPLYANEMAAAIKDQLAKLMPEHEDAFQKNYSELSAQLKDLDRDFKAAIDSSKRKEIIVSHSAYHYWEKRYGIEQISISGVSTTNEPSHKELKELISYAKEKEMKYVINEQNFQSKLAKTVQKEIGAKSLTLHNLSVLTEDDLSKKETYFTLMEKNLSTLKKALNE
ncbi:zinc ABC transporter substrate-binding protein [Bacillus sp. REN3]|uniref:metal ABC transporter solute-binding protein, Zn/Mn family n=1 Tax=Bacillus sp. REN3 TaxID=2802440 RepID=UPI001AEDB99D|nr:zinc ABC transporter substrate-binding protein [Bacillus sp. REN3]